MPSVHPLGGPQREFQPTRAFTTAPTVTFISPNSDRVAGGSTVTITGTGFRLAADGSQPVVMFGSVPATNVIVVSVTSLTCTVPASTVGVVSVSVTCGSQTGTLQGAFTYYTSTITGIDPSHGAASGGTDVVVLGHNFIEGSLIYFDGLMATNIVFVDSEHYLCRTPAHAYGFVNVTLVEPL